MYSVKKLYRPHGIAQALEILSKNPGAVPYAGGTDLFVRMRRERTKDATLVSLALLQELRGISLEDDGSVRIGALSTFTDLAQSRVISEQVPMLKQAALSMGGPQTQNAATIGGNVCNAAVSADSAPSLFALDAQLELMSKDKTRRVRIEDFYQGPGKCAKNTGEILTSIYLPLGALSKWGGYYIKMSTRKAMDISRLGSAAVCELGADGSVKHAAIALGTAGPVPFRCTEAEKLVQGKLLSEDLLGKVGKLAAAASKPRDSWRASAEYRLLLAEELSARSLRQAYRLAGGTIV